jgi:hypothetical protein
MEIVVVTHATKRTDQGWDGLLLLRSIQGWVER